MKAPQIIMIIIFTSGVVLNLVNHGKRKEGKYDFWSALIATIIEIVILRWGGFF